MATVDFITEEEEMGYFESLLPSPEEIAAEKAEAARRADFEAWADAEADRLAAEWEAEMEEEDGPEGPSLPFLAAGSTEEDDPWATAYEANVRQEPVGFLSVEFEQEQERFWKSQMERLHAA